MDDPVPDVDGRELSPSARRLLRLQPPVLWGQPLARAVAAAQAEQLDKLDAAASDLEALLIPKSSGRFVFLWEAMVRIGSDPSANEQARVQAVLAFLARMTSSGSGKDWVAVARSLIGTGWTYTHDPSARLITIHLGSVAPGFAFGLAQRLFEEITPAGTIIHIENPDGLLLDDGTTDQHELG